MLGQDLLTTAATQPVTQTGVAATPVQPSQEVLNAYQTLFGRQADLPGAQYWSGTGLTGQALLDAMSYGAKGTDIGALYNKADTDISSSITTQDIKNFMGQNINDPYAIYSAAQQYNVDPQTIAAVMGYSPEDSTGFLNKYNLANTVAQEYSDIGRGLSGLNSVDKEGFNYWFNQLLSGAITPQDFEKTFLSSAMDVVKSGYDADVTSKTIAESVAKGYGGLDLIDQANPLDVYEALGKYGATPEDVVKNFPTLTTDQVSTYLSKVPDLYKTNVDQTIQSILGADYASSIDPEVKQNLVNQLLTGDITRAEVADMFSQSNANKQQEAARIANSYVSMFGGTVDDAKALYAKLMGVDYTGPGTVSADTLKTAQSIFDTSLTDEKAGLDSLLKTAANVDGAENTEFFKANPTALAVYRDVGETVQNGHAGAGGQYGYFDGKPILKASEVDSLFNEMGTDYIQGDAAGWRDNYIGWDTGSLSGLQARGAAAFGIRRDPVMSNDSFVTTPTGQYTYSGDMNAVAQQLGIDPNQFQDIYETRQTEGAFGLPQQEQVLVKSAQDQLYDAINDKTKDFLFMVGKTGTEAGGIGGEGGESAAFQDAPQNHVAQMYQRIGDKYIPVGDAKYFDAGMELSRGGWFSQTFGGLASIPGIAEIAAFTIPGAAAWYPAIKATQTAALGGDFGDMLKSGATAYVGQNVLPKFAGDLSGGISDLGVTNPIINQALTQGVVSGGVSTLLGGSGTEGFTSGAISGGIGGGIDMVKPEFIDFAKDIGVPSQYAGVFANTLASLAPTLLTGGSIDPTKVLMSYLMRSAMSKNKQPTATT